MSLHLYKSFTHAQIFADKRNLTELLPFFNSLKPSATQVYLAQETSLIKFGINGKGSIFFIELGMHFGGGVSPPLVFFSFIVRKGTSPRGALTYFVSPKLAQKA